MTPDDFMGAALDNPGTVAQGLGAGLMDSFTTSTSVGMAYRDSQTPSLAKTPTEIAGFPGRGGGQQYRYESEGEVAARGDKLLGTEEKQRLSPYHRDAIPHEKGMTESRLKVMSEDYDLSQVRRHYMEKRPMSAFIGGIIGTVADPINFIPIVGEAGTAFAIGKAGRVAGRALVGAADATISTAVFDAVTMKERAKFGDPMDFNAFAMDMAFSALAGSLIGGTIGIFSRKGSKVSEEALMQSMTKADKAKAAVVMNDAIDSMITYGEVRLSPQAQEFSAQVGRTIEMADSGVTARQLGVTRYSVDGVSENLPQYAADAGAKPLLKWEDDFKSVVKSDYKSAPDAVKEAIDEDVKGVFVGQARNLDLDIIAKKYTLEEVAAAFQGTRELIRQRYGNQVVLYRYDAPKNTRAKDAMTVYMADKEFSKKFGGADAYGGSGRKGQPYLVDVDDIIAAHVGEKKYREFIVKIPDGNLIPYTGKISEAPTIGQVADDVESRQFKVGEIMQAMRDDMEGLAEMQQEMFGKVGLNKLDMSEVNDLRDRIIGGPPRKVGKPLPSEQRVAAEAKAVLGKEPWTGRTNYSGATVSATEVGFKTEMTKAEAEVSSLPKTSDVNKLQEDDAKADGIDIETGKNDLDDEVRAIAETLPDNEKKAFQDVLDEADMEFQKASTFGEVLTFASQCFIR